ncbi:lytic transglycosylase domain-containing protein [Anaerosinus massiliensis]|uniref:lytic transglycosylase domain-containing protein n=1 Tax=Massilibacillus massiliensis TaxID=1806837 RepID=UPI000ACD46FB|nr:lytic transglycosylase domain-containing protein [Massilibacillus massiliensis]
MMEGINQVLQRIHTIEDKFSPKNFNNYKFQAYVDQAMKQKNGEINSKAKTGNAATMANKSVASNTASADIASLIDQAAHKYGVDPSLVNAVAKTESNYTADAVSDAGAVGIMQLMPATADSLGVKNIYDPRDNIEGGVKYIKQLLNTFDGDVSKAVAAYNAGPQAVKNYNGIPPYAETQNYVRKVLDLYS